MARVINLVHFTKDHDNSKLVVDEYAPGPNERGYVDEGYFYISISKGDQRMSMKLNEAEAALLAIRLMKAVESHAVTYMDIDETQRMKRKR